MNDVNVQGAAAKLENALKLFRTTFAGVESQWSDAARNEFQETHLAPMEPHVKAMLASIARLTTVLAGAQSQCGSQYGGGDE